MGEGRAGPGPSPPLTGHVTPAGACSRTSCRTVGSRGRARGKVAPAERGAEGWRGRGRGGGGSWLGTATSAGGASFTSYDTMSSGELEGGGGGGRRNTHAYAAALPEDFSALGAWWELPPQEPPPKFDANLDVAYA